jgi:hypothetical protein
MFVSPAFAKPLLAAVKVGLMSNINKSTCYQCQHNYNDDQQIFIKEVE